MDEEILYNADGAQQEGGAAETASEKYLLFTADSLLFGSKAEYVVEIITNHVITPLPLVPDYIRGIINLRGQILPIVDIRLLLGRPAAQDSCVIILNVEGTLVGILVDAVQKMLDIDKSSILHAPDTNAQDFVSGMCSLDDGQTMLVFHCPQILNQT